MSTSPTTQEMTSITVKYMGFEFIEEVPSTQDLRDQILSLVKQARIKWGCKNTIGCLPEYINMTYSNSDEMVHRIEGAKIGTRPITVDVGPPVPLSLLRQRLIADRKTLVEHNPVRDKPRVCSLVARILEIVCGAEDFGALPRKHFSSLGKESKLVRQLAIAMNTTPTALIQHADAFMDKWFTAVDPGSLEALDEEVADVRQRLTPHHEQQYGWECSIIRQYEQLKAAFMARFHNAYTYEPEAT